MYTSSSSETSLVNAPWFIALVIGVVSWPLLHVRPIRGDTGLIFECLIGTICFCYQWIEVGASMGTALTFALVAVLCHFAGIAAATIAWRVSPLHPLANFPGPLLYKCTNMTLATDIWFGRRHVKMLEFHGKYGKVVRIAPDTLSIDSAAAIAPIYSSSHAFLRSNAYSRIGISGEGLFFSASKEFHSHRRRHWATAFTPAMVTSYMPAVHERTQQLTEVLIERSHESKDGVDLGRAFQHWSYDTMGDMTFSGTNRLELMKDGDINGYVDGGHLATRVFDVLGHVPTIADIICHFSASESIRKLEDVAHGMINQRAKAQLDHAVDISSSLLLGEGVSSQPKLNIHDLRVETLFAIQAGSDTASGVLSIGFYYLLSNKTAYGRLQQELDDAFPDTSPPLDMERLESLPYLDATVQEMLRLGSPFPGFPRVTPKGGAHLAGVYIPEGTIVGVPTYAQALNPENFWPDPESFIPERWLPGGLGPDSRTTKMAVLAFSHGPYGCLGKQLAIKQMRVVIAKLLLTLDMSLAPGFDDRKFVEGIRNWRSTLLDYPLRVKVANRH